MIARSVNFGSGRETGGCRGFGTWFRHRYGVKFVRFGGLFVSCSRIRASVLPAVPSAPLRGRSGRPVGLAGPRPVPAP